MTSTHCWSLSHISFTHCWWLNTFSIIVTFELCNLIGACHAVLADMAIYRYYVLLGLTRESVGTCTVSSMFLMLSKGRGQLKELVCYHEICYSHHDIASCQPNNKNSLVYWWKLANGYNIHVSTFRTHLRLSTSVFMIITQSRHLSI